MQALVVDDSPAVRKLVVRMLSELGWDVREAENGRDGLSTLEQCGSVDLALIDAELGGMDGYEFVRSVRRRSQWSSTRLVMVSSETDAERILAALNAGADEYIMKPFTRDMLADKLAILGLAEATT